MIKKILFAVVLAGSLTACKEDFKDWTLPTPNEAPEAGSASVSVSAVSTPINLDEVTTDEVQILTFTNSADVTVVENTLVLVNNDKTYDLSPSVDGKVEKDDLTDAIIYLHGNILKEREMAGTLTTKYKVGDLSYTQVVESIVFKATIPDSKSAKDLFMTGSEYGWGNEKWVQLTPVNGVNQTYWTLLYFRKDEQIKFAPQADWGGDFSPATTEGNIAEASTPDNVVIGKAGWYIIVVNAEARTIEFFEPNVYLIGGTTSGWDVSDDWKFSVPEGKDGQFVSPALANDGEVRICVHPMETVDWWRMEFIILDGKIAYRGNGGDQDRVNATAGQKVYLNFTTGDGEIK